MRGVSPSTPKVRTVSHLHDRIAEHAEALFAEIKAVREHLHRELPELAMREFRTTAYIREQLAPLGLDYQQMPSLKTGVVAILRGTKDGGSERTVALRADIDALPIKEETGLPYSSQAAPDGVATMHACGHDGHTAILIGAARILADLRPELPGNVKLVFQPAEESIGGAAYMVRDGVLRDPPVGAIFALHCRTGTIGPGEIQLQEVPNASADAFSVEVRGSGGHGAYPHEVRDPIVAAAAIVAALQTIVSREVAPGDQGVVTVGVFRAGSQSNIVPDVAHLEGTIRARDAAVQEALFVSVRRICERVAEAHRTEAQVRIEAGYPVVRNSPEMLDVVRRVGQRMLGPEAVHDCEEITMGGEDFAFYLEDQGGVPGAIFRIGIESTAPGHASKFDFGSQALVPGMKMMAGIAAAHLCSVGATGRSPLQVPGVRRLTPEP